MPISVCRICHCGPVCSESLFLSAEERKIEQEPNHFAIGGMPHDSTGFELVFSWGNCRELYVPMTNLGPTVSPVFGADRAGEKRGTKLEKYGLTTSIKAIVSAPGASVRLVVQFNLDRT